MVTPGNAGRFAAVTVPSPVVPRGRDMKSLRGNACADGGAWRTMEGQSRLNPHPHRRRRMSLDDRELMLWALGHGWSVTVFGGRFPGSLWKDTARRRHLVHGVGPSPELPALSDELRARLRAAHAAAVSRPQSLAAR